MNDTDINVFDDTGNGTDQSATGTDTDTSPVEDFSDTGDGSASTPSDSASDLPADETGMPEDTANGSETASLDSDMDSDTEGDLTGETAVDGETAADGEPTEEDETGEGENSGFNEELVQHIDDTLTEHSSAFDSYVECTVSGNGININLDDYTTELLETSVQNQGEILEKMDYLGGLLLIIFLVLVVDYIYRQTKRIIKNFMKGDDSNE